MKNKKYLFVVIIALIIMVFLIVLSNKINRNYIDAGKIDDVKDVISSTNNKVNDIDWNDYKVYDVVLDKSLEITKEGIYNLSGKIDNGQIHVDTFGNVKLNLNNVSINNSSGPSIYVEKCKTIEINTLDNTINTLSDGNTYDGYDEEVNGSLFSNNNLILSGNGILNVVSNSLNGIVTKDNLKITSGSYDVTSLGDSIKSSGSIEIVNGNLKINSKSDKGIKAKDNIIILNGIFNFDTKDDAINSSNCIAIGNGSYDIVSLDDAIHADKCFIIDNGNINVNNAYEGIESPKIIINSGKVNIVSLDDGINASNKDSNQDDDKEEIIINNGEIYIDSSGDGFDSNGSIYMNGGNVTILGPVKHDNSAIDYDSEFKITSGTLLAIGSSNMAQNISPSSSQYGVLINFKDKFSENTSISIRDENNKEVISYLSKKIFQSIVISTNDFVKDNEYSIFIDNKKYNSFIIKDIVTNININN